jgi:4-amino-4-deoxy-L-arabinose transferase-like glycosyltransferase
MLRDAKPGRQMVRCALPGMLLAALCLLPFLNKAFTIDDPYFLYEARQTLVTPRTPTSAVICWENVAYKRTLHTIGPNGPLMGYLLLPVILSGGREWVGHLLILAIFLGTVVATVALAFRCGADGRAATLAGLIFASTPVVLGMAGTVMPDIPATALAVLGMERLLSWKEERKLHQALMAGAALGIAPLGRTHAIFLLPIAAFLLVDGSLWPPSWRKIRELGLARVLPVLLAAFAFVFLTWLTFDHAPHAVFPTAPNADQLAIGNIWQNLPNFGADWMLTTGFGIAWLMLDGTFAILTLATLLVGGQVVRYALDYPPATFLSIALAGAMAMASVMVEAWRSGKRVRLGLALWLLIPLPILPYTHFPPKYFVACAPAAAILLAWKLSRLPKVRLAMASGLTIAAGAAFGLAIVKADADFAGSARQVVAEEIVPHIRAGGQAWYFGQWALNWYAENAGANCLTNDPPYPSPGDLLIADRIDGSANFITSIGAFRGRLVRVISPGAPGGRVYNQAAGAGFYSNHSGYWPWKWSSEPLNTYFVWVLE